GVYLNPDEIESSIRRDNTLDIDSLDVDWSLPEIQSFFAESGVLRNAALAEDGGKLISVDGMLVFDGIEVGSYHASVIVEFLRRKLLEQRRSFTFESVMSHPAKVRFLEDAQAAGYRTYLYYVATDDPDINISRVRNRVALGGHAVPEGKIFSRYYRSLELLMVAIKRSHRAYIFDNSTDNADGCHTWLAEVTDGARLELKTDRIPDWFKQAVLDKI
ncbi:MAG: hypothetical protein EOP87_12130, partial [Verrucomicrobiaceae bacterium]